MKNLNIISCLFFYGMLLSLFIFIGFMGTRAGLDITLDSVLFGSFMPWCFSIVHSMFLFGTKGATSKVVNMHFLTLGMKLVEIVVVMLLGIKLLALLPTYVTFSYVLILLLTHFFETYLASEIIQAGIEN